MSKILIGALIAFAGVALGSSISRSKRNGHIATRRYRSRSNPYSLQRRVRKLEEIIELAVATEKLRLATHHEGAD